MSRKEYNAMTMETEMSPPATESNGGDGSDATITCASETSKSNSSNGGQGCTNAWGYVPRGRRIRV